MDLPLEYIISILNTGLTALGVLAGVYFIMRYLQRGEGGTRVKELELLRSELNLLRESIAHSAPSPISGKDLEELNKEVANIKATQTPLTKDQREKFIVTLSEKLQEESAQKILINIEEKFSQKFEDKQQNDIVEKHFVSTIDRLKEELFSLSKRGNLNLSIGIMTTIVGITLLGMFILSGKPTSTSINSEQFFIEFIPRISLVILIEIFAYFFLRLYKANLSEIKYFQNEITTIESKYLSLKVAVFSGDAENVKKVLDHLSAMERNFILDKGQSTVDLERSRIESRTTTDLLDKIAELIGKKS